MDTLRGRSGFGSGVDKESGRNRDKIEPKGIIGYFEVFIVTYERYCVDVDDLVLVQLVSYSNRVDLSTWTWYRPDTD